MRKIAFEEHVGLPELAALAREQRQRLDFPVISDPKRQSGLLDPLLSADPEAHRLPLMDVCGLDMQVVSAASAPIQQDEDACRAVRNARLANEKIAGLIRAHPSRFAGMGTLPMQEPAAAAEEAERCVRELGFIGFMLHGPSDFHYYDEPQFDPVWTVLEKYGTPLYLHPANPEKDQIRMYEGFPQLLGHTWNWNVVTATHALRIIFSGLFDQHPNAMLMLGHMGEGLPYFLGRLDEGYCHRGAQAQERMAHEPSYYIRRNVYITTSGRWAPEAMHCALEALGAEHILFANDYPHYPLEDSMQHMEDAALSPVDLALIYHGNAERLWHI